MQGRNMFRSTRSKKSNSNYKKTIHCMIYREVLVSISFPSILAAVLNEVVKVVNYIKTSVLR